MTPTEIRQLSGLTGVFFRRIFESELVHAGSSQVQLLTAVFAFIGAPSVLLPLFLTKKYVWLSGDAPLLHQALAADRDLGVAVAAGVSGLVSLVIWQALFPDRRDAVVLGALPIRVLVVVAARGAAISALFGLILVATGFLSALGFAFVGAGFSQHEGFFRILGGHFVNVLAAEAAVFYGLLTTQCLVWMVLGPRSALRAATVLQCATVVAIMQIPLIATTTWHVWSPRMPLWGIMMFAAAVVTYAGGYRRMTRLVFEQAAGRHSRISIVKILSSLTGAFPEASQSHAVRIFALRTLARSHQHRLLFAGSIGFALALAIAGLIPPALSEGWAGFARPHAAVLAVPLLIQAVSLTVMRMLFAVPFETRANWVVRVQGMDVRNVLDGASSALFAVSLLPMAIAFCTAFVLWGGRVAALHAAFTGSLGFLLAQVLATSLRKMPFTCTYVSGKAKVTLLWPVYLLVFSTYTYSMASLEETLLREGGVMQALIAIVSLTAGVRYFRKRRVNEALRFEEQPDSAPTVISLS